MQSLEDKMKKASNIDKKGKERLSVAGDSVYFKQPYSDSYQIQCVQKCSIFSVKPAGT